MNDRANTAVDGRRKQHQDDIVLMAIEGSDFCPMVIGPVIEYEDIVSHDSNEIQDSFIDRFTYESDNEYDHSYDSTPFDDDDYGIVSMITDFDLLQEKVCNNHEWGMMTTNRSSHRFRRRRSKTNCRSGTKTR
jgi:hypothetical protein